MFNKLLFKNDLGNQITHHKSVTILVILLSLIVSGIIFLSSGLEVNALYRGVEDNTGGYIFPGYIGEFDRNDRHTPINLTVASPLQPSVKKYSPGEEFNFQIDFSAVACNNKPQYLEIYTLNEELWAESDTILSDHLVINESNGDADNISWWKNSSSTIQIYTNTVGGSVGGINVGGHERLRNFSPSAHGGYIAPSIPGIYRFYFYIRIYASGDGDGVRLAYVNVEVANPISTEEGDGACGTADNTIKETKPTSSLCASGNPTPLSYTAYDVIDTSTNPDTIGEWKWTCEGVGEGFVDSPTCKTKKSVDVGVGVEDEDGECGTATAGVSGDPSSFSTLCKKGDPVSIRKEGSEWKWTCEGTIGNDDYCQATEDPGMTSQEPTILSVSMSPSIVNQGQFCTLQWEVNGNGSTGSCQISNHPDTYLYSGGIESFSVSDIEPKRLYSVTCTENALGLSVTSRSLSCSLNPNVIEN